MTTKTENSKPYVPYQQLYDRCRDFFRIGNSLLLAAIVLSLLFPLYKMLNLPALPVLLYNGLMVVNLVLIIGQFAFITASELHFYPKAEEARVQGLFDNALQTKKLERPLEDYFDNQSLPIGVRKLVVDSFENCYFTYNVAREMTPVLVVMNAVFFILFIVVAFLGFSTDTCVSLAQAFISQAFLLRLIRHLYFIHHVSTAYEGFKHAFSIPTIPDAYALYAMVNYEKALSGYSSMTNGKAYARMRDRLNAGWEDMKKTYNLN